MTKRHKDVQRRDIFGRNLSYLQSCLPQLGQIESMDLYSHDLESGYTPLHVTLKRGHLRKSFMLYKHWKDEIEYLSHKLGGHVLAQVDREGLTPLELYNLELQNPNGKYPIMFGYRAGDNGSLVKWGTHPEEGNVHGSYVLTWGSNVNYQLGTGTKDDRQNMFQLPITQLEKGGYLPSGAKFRQAFMRRYHSLLLTTDNKIYTCGIGSRGRLGNDMSESPQPTFTQVLDLENLDVKMIASSDHHTLVLTSDRSIFSWGWNAYGQLGHALGRKVEEKNLNKITVPSAKKINFLDGESVDFLACSKVHSCAATRSGHVLMWGLNLGQMGGTKPIHATPEVQYHNEDGYIVQTPMVVNLANRTVEQIVCTELATFIRTQGNTLHIFSNFTMRTFKIPLPKSRAFKEVDAFDHFTPREVPSEVVDMKCSNRFGNKVCFSYSCGRVGIISIKEESAKMWSKMSNYLPVALYWTPNFKDRRCQDFDVSAQGKLILCTVGGEIFTVDSVNGRPEKIYSGKLVTGRALSVSCDSSFGSFAAIKGEINDIPIIYPKDSLYFDFSQYSPLRGRNRSRESTIWGLLNEPQFCYANYLSNHNVSSEIGREDKYSEAYKVKSTGSSLADFEEAKTIELSQEKIRDEADFDVLFSTDCTGEIICYCHKTILQSRCGNFTQRIATYNYYKAKNALYEFILKSSPNDKVWLIAVSGEKDPSEFLSNFVHFLYTDERLFGHKNSTLLFDLVDNSHHLSRLSISLQELLEKNSSEDINGNTDTRIIATDGVLKAHSLILSTRSAFFQVMLSKEWVSMGSNGIHIINLAQIELANMESLQFILNYLYGMEYERICSDVKKQSFTEYLQFFLDVLELSDMFNLECFKNFLESVVATYINGETVISILINATYSNCRLLTLNCCWFLCTHLAVLFSKQNIEVVNQHFDISLWQLLENVLKDMRSQSMQVQAKSWYEDTDFDWVSLFRNNLKGFNERFMNPKHAFAPIFDLKPPASEHKPRTKSSGRRLSATPSQSKNRRSSFITGDKIVPRRPSYLEEKRSVWVDRTDDTAIEDSDDFIEVMRKPKRRTSSQVHKQPEVKATDHVDLPELPEQAGKVVIHSATEDSSTSFLPSLLPLSKVTDLGAAVESESSSARVAGTFKKSSQKQRMKQVILDGQSSKAPVWKKSTWGSRVSSSHSQNSGSSKHSLPSLYDSDSGSKLNVSKKEKKKNNKLAPNTEFVSHGNIGGISPYLQNTAMAQATVANTDVVSPKLTLEERAAAQEFEKWFTEQSQSVQKQLNNKKSKNLARELDVMYNAARSLPDFIRGPEEKPKKNKKKLKLKFESKQAQDFS